VQGVIDITETITMENRKIRLKVGKIYFHATFKDSSYETPIIDTLKFIGVDDEYGYVFENIHEDNTRTCFPVNNIYFVYDNEALCKWLTETVGSKNKVSQTYEYYL